MPASWSGHIVLDGHDTIESVILSAFDKGSEHAIHEASSLRFLSVVEVSRIPLHLVVGTRYAVTTASHETERWFSRFLLASQDGTADGASSPWWQTTRLDSPLGVLVSVTDTRLEPGPRITELLFYASRSGHSQRPPTPPKPSPGADRTHPELQLHAFALSSDLIYTGAWPSPPASPSAEDDETGAVFLPSIISTDTGVIHEPPVRKRKTIDDTFNEATERRRKARRKGGEGVAAAAALKAEDSLPNLKHRPSVSGPGTHAAPLQTRPFSRSPSLTSSRPATARAPSEATKRSSLSRVESVAGQPEEATTESKNKDLVSRIIMAGMRLYGLSQTKSRKSRANSSAPSPAVDMSSEQRQNETQKDDEYKLVYHQAFKSTCFAFRHHMATLNLQPHTEALRETVDKLLATFCHDPLKAGLPRLADKLTPGGRKAFGSAVHAQSAQRTFADAASLGIP